MRSKELKRLEVSNILDILQKQMETLTMNNEELKLGLKKAIDQLDEKSRQNNENSQLHESAINELKLQLQNNESELEQKKVLYIRCYRMACLYMQRVLRFFL